MRIQPEGLLYGAEHDLLAIPKFLVTIDCSCSVKSLLKFVIKRHEDIL